MVVKKGDLRLSINLTPLIPLSLKRRGGDNKKRGEAPLKRPVTAWMIARDGENPKFYYYFPDHQPTDGQRENT